MDIRDALAAMAPAAHPPSADVVAADIARGHRAVARRRRRVATVGATLGVVGVLGLTAVVQAASSPDGPAAQVSTATEQPAGLRLVPYSGPPTGAFTTSLIPEGWTVLSGDDFSLVLAPPGADPSPAQLRDKILISLGLGFSDREPAGTGTIVELESGGSAVRIDLDDGNYLAVQFPAAGERWTEQQMLELARGVHVGEDAQPIAG